MIDFWIYSFHNQVMQNNERQHEDARNKSNIVRSLNHTTNRYRGHLRYFSGKGADIKAPEPIDNFPARMDYNKTADFLGFKEHDIPILVFYGLLIPLGTPPPNAKKYFARATLVQLAHDVEWLHAAQSAIYGYWQTKNANRSSQQSTETSVTA